MPVVLHQHPGLGVASAATRRCARLLGRGRLRHHARRRRSGSTTQASEQEAAAWSSTGTRWRSSSRRAAGRHVRGLRGAARAAGATTTAAWQDRSAGRRCRRRSWRAAARSNATDGAGARRACCTSPSLGRRRSGRTGRRSSTRDRTPDLRRAGPSREPPRRTACASSAPGPNQLVAVVMEKGWEQVAARPRRLALRRGLPADRPALPRERRGLPARARRRRALALTQPWLAERLEWPEGVARRGRGRGRPDAGTRRLGARPGPDDLAYVIFTSGSTGAAQGGDDRPPRRGQHVARHQPALRRRPRRTGCSRSPRSSFDLSVYDIFGMLAAGGTRGAAGAARGAATPRTGPSSSSATA